MKGKLPFQARSVLLSPGRDTRVVVNLFESVYQTVQLFTRVRIFLNPHLFLSRFKNCQVHTYPDSNRIFLSRRIQHASGLTQVPRNIGNRACVVRRTKFASCSAFHGKELGSILLRHRIKDYPDIASTLFRIHGVLKNFHSGERIQKTADSYAVFTEYVWMEAISGKKKLRI